MQVIGQKCFNSELSGIWLLECVELVRVGTGNQNLGAGQQYRRGMVHPGNVGPCLHLEGAIRWVVDHGVERGIAGKFPPCRAFLGSVDEQHATVGEQDHVTHHAWERHVQHGPLWIGSRCFQKPARLRCGVLRFGVGVGIVVGTPAHQNGSLGETVGIVQRQHHGGTLRGVIAGFTFYGGILAQDVPRVGVKQNRVAPSEDKDIAGGQQVQKRVQILVVSEHFVGLLQEG